MGTIETEKGRIHICSELRSPLDNPLGKGRKGHIRPDYLLSFEPITDPSQTVVVIKCKQYRKAKTKNFVDALIDYARGRPNAKVILVNYGAIPGTILGRVNETLKQRTLLIGNFLPSGRKALGETEEFNIFKNALLQCIPNPIYSEEEIKEVTLKEIQFNLITVDISGSMEKVLDEERVLRILQMIVTSSPNAKLLAIDTTVKKEWSKAKIGLPELLDLPRNGETDLPSALLDFNLEHAVILTDDDGWNQLSNMDFPPYLVIEVSSEKTLYFHFRQ